MPGDSQLQHVESTLWPCQHRCRGGQLAAAGVHNGSSRGSNATPWPSLQQPQRQRQPSRRRGSPIPAAASSGGDGGGATNTDTISSSGGGLLWGDGDEVGFEDIGQDVEPVAAAPPAAAPAAAAAAAAADPLDLETGEAPTFIDQQQQQQQQRAAAAAPTTTTPTTLSEVLADIPQTISGPFKLPDESEESPDQHGISDRSSSSSSSSSGMERSSPPSAADEEGWLMGGQEAALLLQARSVSTFEQAAAFTQQFMPVLGPWQIAMLWCRVRQLLLQGDCNVSSVQARANLTAQVPANKQDLGSQRHQPFTSQQAVHMFGGGGSSSSSSSVDKSAQRSNAAAAKGQRGAHSTSSSSSSTLAPAAMATLKNMAALTIRCGRELPPLGAAAALLSLAAAQRRGFNPSRLQSHVLRRLKAQLRDVVATGAAGASPQQLAESLLALADLGWKLQRRQLLTVAAVAAGSAAEAGGAPGWRECSAAEAGLLLVALARSQATVLPKDRLALEEEMQLASALFDAYAEPLVAAVADGKGAVASSTAADAAAAAAVLQALSVLACAPQLLLPPPRQAAAQVVLEVLEQHMQALDGTQLAAAAVALDQLGIEPWEDWLRDLHAALAQPGAPMQLPGALVCGVLCALPHLGAPPPDALVADLARALSGRLCECSARQIAAAPVALLALRHQPQRYWLDAYWTASAACDARAVPPMELAGAVAASEWLARGSGAAPSPEWCARMGAALAAAAAGDGAEEGLTAAHWRAAAEALAALGGGELGAAVGAVGEEAAAAAVGTAATAAGPWLPSILSPALSSSNGGSSSSDEDEEQQPQSEQLWLPPTLEDEVAALQQQP